LAGISQEILEKFRPLFNPRAIAFPGASKDPGKWGYIILNNLIKGGYRGKVYPVNPKEAEILGLKGYSKIEHIPETPDLAVIVVPPRSVVSVVKDCVKKGIKAGIVITAGFAEIGGEGKDLQKEMVEAARAGGMILLGPNCNGIMNPADHVHVQFPSFYPQPGPIAVIAQSGNVVDSVARQIMLRGHGLSKAISAGNQADLTIEDYLEYLGEDPQTGVILGYVEGIEKGQKFLHIAGKVSRRKPIIILKAGSSEAGAQAAMSHTASIAGSDVVFDAVCRQTGIIRVSNLNELLNIGMAFLRQPLPRGRRVGIVTGGGGWGVLAADVCARLRLEVVCLPEKTIKELDAFMPPWWNRGNPVDLVANVQGDNVFKAVEVVLDCPKVDGVLMMSIMPALQPGRLSSPAKPGTGKGRGGEAVQAVVEVIERFNSLAEKHQKPVIVASEHMFADAVMETQINYGLGQHQAICHQMPHQAARVFQALSNYADYLNRT
jgi:acyl-CoA synthetase (NDP forming)